MIFPLKREKYLPPLDFEKCDSPLHFWELTPLANITDLEKSSDFCMLNNMEVSRFTPQELWLLKPRGE